MTLQDAIYEVLGIPLEQQPADKYRLLGLVRFEANHEVIANAASRQMLYVRQLAVGPYSAVSQDLLNLLSEAKLCLLNASSRRAYDADLRRRLGASTCSSIGSIGGGDSGASGPSAGTGLSTGPATDSATGPADAAAAKPGGAADDGPISELLESLGSVEFPPDIPPRQGAPLRRGPAPVESLDSASVLAGSSLSPEPGRRVMSPLPGGNRPRAVSDAHAFPGSPRLAATGPARHSGPAPSRQWVIGADAHCDIVVHCQYVSRRHCRVTQSGSQFWVEDLGSRNGTHVNNRVVQGPTPVTEEDLVTLGTLARMPWPPEAPAERPGSVDVRIVRIGRSASNDVTLDHPSVSRRHAQLTILGDKTVLEDLGSTNGTFVGASSMRINRRPVEPADEVRIGKFTFPVSHLLQEKPSAASA
ncbi:MAG: FHA domain-containing protein [Planctomycetota bacterium]